MLLEELLSAKRGAGVIDYAGIAPLSSAREFIRDQGGDCIAELPTGISIGIALPNAVVDLQGPSPAGGRESR